jgi:hypothetical protein
MSKKKQEELQTIDPTALAQVSGGTAAPAAAGNDAVMTALTSVLDSLKSLAGSQQQSGFGPQEMMLMMMMMGNRNNSGAQVAAQQPNNWTYDATNGYWIVK